MCNNTNLEKTVDVQTSLSVSSRNDVQMSLSVASGKSDISKKILTAITSNSINVPPVKRCVKCVGCKNCTKKNLPNQVRQLAQADIVRKSLSFDKKGYKASYTYNKLLSQLEVNKRPCRRMMK